MLFAELLEDNPYPYIEANEAINRYPAGSVRIPDACVGNGLKTEG